MAVFRKINNNNANLIHCLMPSPKVAHKRDDNKVTEKGQQ